MFAIEQFAIKKFNRLIIPYFVSFGLLILWSLFVALFKHDFLMPLRHALSMLWGSSEEIGQSTIFNNYFGGIWISYLWFIPSLFWGLCVFYWLSKWPKWYMPICFGISIFACLIYKYTTWLPWGIMAGLGSLQFIAIGHWLRDHKLPIWFWLFCVLCYLWCVFYSGVSIRTNGYECYPIDVLGALGGTFMVYLLALCLNKLKYCGHILTYIGMISLPILCMHQIEPFTDIFNSIRIRSAFFMQLPDLAWIGIRYCAVIVSAIIFTKLPFFRKIYH